MNDRRDAFDKLDDEDKQEIQRYDVNEGVVDNVVSQAKAIIHNEDNHQYGSRAEDPPASTESISESISIPSEEVQSSDLSAALVRIAGLQYQGGGDIGHLKGNISSALLMKLDEAYPKYWEIRLAHQGFPTLFQRMSGVESLHIAHCSTRSKGWGSMVVGIGMYMKNIEYICFEDIEGNAGQEMESVETAVFKNVDKIAGTGSEMRNAVFLNVTVVDNIAFEKTILHDVSMFPHEGLDNDQPITAYINKAGSPLTIGGSRTWINEPHLSEVPIETILYDASAGVNVPQDMADTVRPLTDEELRIITDLADGPPPGKDEVKDVMARLAKGVGQDE